MELSARPHVTMRTAVRAHVRIRRIDADSRRLSERLDNQGTKIALFMTLTPTGHIYISFFLTLFADTLGHKAMPALGALLMTANSAGLINRRRCIGTRRELQPDQAHIQDTLGSPQVLDHFFRDVPTYTQDHKSLITPLLRPLPQRRR